MDLFKNVEKAVSLLNSIDDIEEKLYLKQSEYDSKLQFWLHYLENNKVNTKQSYRITRELKKLRIERREIKNNIDLLRSFRDREDKLRGKDNRCILMGEFSKLPNIGMVVEEQLNSVGINTVDELMDIGSKEAWLRIKEIDDTVCLNRLMALEGAIQNIRWHNLSENDKTNLKDFYNLQK